jgi:signal transduction histidine kinase
MKAYGGDGYSVNSSWVFDVHESQFKEMLTAIPSMGQRCVSVLLDRVREVTRMEGQAEKLSALGKLAGNLSHELNNPASAAQRSAASLYGQLRHYGDQKYKLGNLRLSEEQTGHYQSWIRRTRERMTDITAHSRINPSLLSETDREEQLQRWLAAREVPEPWNVAAIFAENFIGIEQLEEYAQVADPTVLPLAISTLASSLRAERMAETVVDATVRIFDLISAIKSYSYMDQAAIQDVDLAQSLEATLQTLGSRLHDVTIEREFDPELPPVSAYGSELSQVWTTLIENALDAMADNQGPKVLKLTTHNAAGMAYVEVWDNGHGVDPAIESRIFEPFFTTKAVGSGLGLGLDTAQRIVARHFGFLTVESKPGATCFQVRLPFDQAQAY